MDTLELRNSMIAVIMTKKIAYLEKSYDKLKRL